MKDVLQDIVVHMQSSHYKNEEHIRLGVVCRLLIELGWDIWHPRAMFPELPANSKEDATRVDLALFMPPQFLRPAVFIEIKAAGKLMPSLGLAEMQLRDYNRNNQADISVLTDGRHWRFYLSSAAGEFSDKCFEKIDFLEGPGVLTDVELALDAFLSMKALESGSAVDEAKKYLKRSDTDRVMYEVLPLAQRDVDEDPSVSLVDCFLTRCAERGADCTRDKAIDFIKVTKSRLATGGAVAAKGVSRPDSFVSTTQTTGPNATTAIREASRLQLVNKRGANAEGEYRAARFVVFKDSIAAPSTEGFKGTYRILRTRLEAEGVLVSDSLGHQTHKLSSDYEFSSASAAASVFCGRSANDGEWKNNL
jgi:hypothetical protein